MTINNLANRETLNFQTIAVLNIKINGDNKMEKEEWKPVVGYEDSYLVSNYGRVKSLKTNKIMSDQARGDKHPYKTVNLSKNNISKKIDVHILVAQAFIINNDPLKTEVDHINKNPKDNYVGNLRWVTPSENCKNRNMANLHHNFDGHRKKCQVKRLDPKTNKVDIFDSILDAAKSLSPKNKKDLHTKTVNINACCKGKQKTCCGYLWSYNNFNICETTIESIDIEKDNIE